jgi:caffeoyl-CoA O-methyltransferase
MVTCEIDPFLAEFSRPFFARSPHGNKIDVRLGAALETMKNFDTAAEGGFDMIFIDADKGGYAGYYEAALSTPGLLNDGGVIVIDNVLFKGQAYRPRQPVERDFASWNEGGAVLADFNKMVADDPRTEQASIP